MNPELAAAIRKLQATKDLPAGMDEEAFIRAETGGKHGLDDATQYIDSIKNENPLRSAGRAFVNAAGMNLPQNMMGLDPALLKGMGHPVLASFLKMLGAHEGGDQEFRLKNEIQHAENPGRVYPAEIVGSAAPFLLGPEAGAAGIAARMAQGAATGATAGTVASMAQEEGTPSERFSKVNKALGIGLPTAIGAIAPALLGGYEYLMHPERAAMRRLGMAVEKSGGAGAVRAKAGEFNAAGLGDEATFGDLSDPLRAETKYSNMHSPESAVNRIRATSTRTADMPQRMMDKTRDLNPLLQTGGGDINAADAAAQLTKDMDAWRKPAYAALEGEVPNTVLPQRNKPGYAAAMADVDAAKKLGVGGKALQGLIDKADALKAPDVDPAFLTQPKVRNALAEAQKEGLIGASPEDADFASFEKLQNLHGRINSATERAFRAKNNVLGVKLAEVRDMLDTHMVENIDGYSAVTKEFARRNGLERALANGADAWGAADTRNMGALVNKLSPDELFRYRQGMASEFIAKLRGDTGQSFAQRVAAKAGVGGESALQDKIATIFGDRKTFDGFMKYAELEHELGRMKGSYSGSDTYAKFMAGNTDPVQQVAQLSTHGLVSPKNIVTAGLTRLGSSRLANLMRSGTAFELAAPLETSGVANIDALLEQIASKKSLVSAPVTTGVPAVSAGLLSRRR